MGSLHVSGCARVSPRFGVGLSLGRLTSHTAPPDHVPAFTDFASRGFDIVIGQGFQFGEVAEQAAELAVGLVLDHAQQRLLEVGCSDER